MCWGLMYQILGRALTFSLPSPGIEGGMGLDVLMEAKTKKKSTRVNDSENIIFLVVDLVLMLEKAGYVGGRQKCEMLA